MLDRVLAYVRSVLSGETKGDAAVGRYLMDTLGGSTDDLEKGSFNAALQVRIFLDLCGGYLLTLRTGYTDGVLPRQSPTIASGGVVPDSSDKHIVVRRGGLLCLQAVVGILDENFAVGSVSC